MCVPCAMWICRVLYSSTACPAGSAFLHPLSTPFELFEWVQLFPVLFVTWALRFDNDLVRCKAPSVMTHISGLLVLWVLLDLGAPKLEHVSTAKTLGNELQAHSRGSHLTTRPVSANACQRQLCHYRIKNLVAVVMLQNSSTVSLLELRRVIVDCYM
jgi:hypothetical protein